MLQLETVRRQQNCKTMPEEPFVKVIIEQTTPQRIFRKQNFFLVVLSPKNQRPLADHHAVLQSHLGESDFVLALINSGEFEKNMNEGHLLYSSISRQENLVYNAGVNPLLLTMGERIKWIAEKARTDFLPGLHRAKRFFEGATFYFRQQEPNLSLFMLHQASEQALRCLLLSLTGQDVRTHSLSELRQHLKKCIPWFSPVLFSDTEQRLLTLLNNSYSASRYMDGFTSDLKDIQFLLSEVSQFLKETDVFFQETVTRFEY